MEDLWRYGPWIPVSTRNNSQTVTQLKDDYRCQWVKKVRASAESSGHRSPDSTLHVLCIVLFQPKPSLIHKPLNPADFCFFNLLRPREWGGKSPHWLTNMTQWKRRQAKTDEKPLGEETNSVTWCMDCGPSLSQESKWIFKRDEWHDQLRRRNQTETFNGSFFLNGKTHLHSVPPSSIIRKLGWYLFPPPFIIIFFLGGGGKKGATL